jgi:hypothetical protein
MYTFGFLEEYPELGTEPIQALGASPVKFAAVAPYDFPNGARGWSPGGPMDCLGPYAKISNCPIVETGLRLTVYATGYATTFFSIPAFTRFRKRYIGGFIAGTDEGPVFHAHDRFKKLLDTVGTGDKQ